MKLKDKFKKSLCVPNFYTNRWIEYLSGTNIEENYSESIQVYRFFICAFFADISG